MSKLQVIDGKQTTWEGLWWHPEYSGFSSAVLSLSEIRKFKGKVRLYVRKNKFYNGGENGRPNYKFCLKDAESDTFKCLIVNDEEEKYARYDDGVWTTNTGERLYTKDEVDAVKYGACSDGHRGYYGDDLLIEDYI